MSTYILGMGTWDLRPPRLKVNSQNSISQIIPVGSESFLNCNVRRWQRDLVIWLSFSPHSLPAMPLNDHIISLMYMSFAELANLLRVPEVHIQVRLHGSIYTVYHYIYIYTHISLYIYTYITICIHIYYIHTIYVYIYTYITNYYPRNILALSWSLCPVLQ